MRKQLTLPTQYVIGPIQWNEFTSWEMKIKSSKTQNVSNLPNEFIKFVNKIISKYNLRKSTLQYYDFNIIQFSKQQKYFYSKGMNLVKQGRCSWQRSLPEISLFIALFSVDPFTIPISPILTLMSFYIT